MKYLTYIIAGLMLIVVGCETIKEAISTPTPDTSIHVEDLISQYQNDKDAFTNKYKDNDLQITVRGTILDRFCCPSGRAYVEIGDEELGDKCLYNLPISTPTNHSVNPPRKSSAELKGKIVKGTVKYIVK